MEIFGGIVSGVFVCGVFVLVINKKKIRRYLLQNSDVIETKAKYYWRRFCSIFSGK